MNKQDVIDILKEILIYYGYNINSSKISDILAEKDKERLFIKFESSIISDNIRRFLNDVQMYNGKGILISEFFDEKAKNFTSYDNIALWDKNKLESWIGKAVLSGALIKKRDNIKKQELNKTNLPSSDKKNEILLHSLPVNIGKSDALFISEKKIGKSEIQSLEFVPVWYYSYSFNTQKKFKSKLIDLSGNGKGYINAINGNNYFIEYIDIHDNIVVPIKDYKIQKMILDKDEAIEKALNSIVEANTKEARLNELIGDTIVFEHKLIAPNIEDINFDIELVHIPFWKVKGKQECIEINGYDGKITETKDNDIEYV